MLKLEALRGLNEDTELGAAAQHWARAGFHPLVLHGINTDGSCPCSKPGCKKPGKHPAGKRWQTEALDLHQVVAELRRGRRNLGLRMGLQPGGVRLLAVDDDGELEQLEAEHGKLPRTLNLWTGSGGRHLLFVVPEGIPIRNRVRIRQGDGKVAVDLRCDGGQIVAAPSRHVSGGSYTVGEIREIAELPEAYLELFRDEEPQADAPAQTAPTLTSRPEPPRDDLERVVERCRLYVGRCEPAIQGSNGSGALLRVARIICHGFALDGQEGWDLLRHWNASSCQPPFREDLQGGPDSLRRKWVQACTTPLPRGLGWTAKGELRDRGGSSGGAAASGVRRTEGPQMPWAPLDEPAGPPPGGGGGQASGGAPPAPRARLESPDDLAQQKHVPFPVDVLPQVMRDWARAQSTYQQVPVTMSATMGLMGLMAASVQCDVEIDGKTWREPTVGQMLLVAAPSERKSPVFAPALFPLREYETRENARREEHRERLKKAVNALGAIEKGSAEEHRAAEMAAELEELEGRFRLLCNDVTPEEFIRLTAEQQERMVLCSDEGDVFGSFGGRYSNGEPKLTPLLNGWDGRWYDYDRVGGGGGKNRVHISVQRPRAAIAVCMQHGVLQSLLEKAAYREKGLLARLLYVVLPERQTARMVHPPRPDPRVLEEYTKLVMFQCAKKETFTLANRMARENGWNEPDWLTGLRQRLETAQLPDGELHDLVDWAGKLVSNMARIAAVLESVGGGGEDQLMQLSEFFIAHARRALGAADVGAPRGGTLSDELVYCVTRLVDMVAKRGPVAVGKPARDEHRRFTTKDTLRACRRYKRMADVEPVLHRLIDSGHVRELPNREALDLGYRAQSRVYELHPALTVKGSWNPEEPLEEIPTHQVEPAPPVGEEWDGDIGGINEALDF